MARLIVHSFSISIDGYGAGPDQSLDSPLGVGGEGLHDWLIQTRAWRELHREEGGETGSDNSAAQGGSEQMGSWILGRNMFGPIRGPWPDEDWHGWWGEEPPYRVPTFVLTHHERPPLTMKGGTEFIFVTGGIEDALDRATAAAGERDVRLGGGVATTGQYLQAGLVDELHLTISPILLGSGEHLFRGIDLPTLGYECVEHSPGQRAVGHMTLAKNTLARGGTPTVPETA